MWRLLVLAVVTVTGCSQSNSEESRMAVKELEKPQVAEKKIRAIVHHKPFNFDGVDRISIVGADLNEVRSPIPFSEKEVDEVELPYEPGKHALNKGEAPDFIHRFQRPDGYVVDFLIKNNRIALLVESTKPYLKSER